MIYKSAATLLGVALTATTANAQAAATCDIDLGSSAQVVDSYEAISDFNSADDEASRRKHLSRAVTLLTGSPDQGSTPVARGWVLGQSLAAWTLVAEQPTVDSRSAFGYATNGDATVDLTAAIDTLFSAVEAEHPGCATQSEQLRVLAYMRVANQAVEQFNSGQRDSSFVLANRALQVYDEGAVAYQLVGNIELHRKNEPAALAAFKLAAEHSAADTSLASVRENSIGYLAYLTQNVADAAAEGEQAAIATEAAGYFREYLKLRADDTDAQAGLARALAMAGDSAASSAIYKGMLADPSKYTELQLVNAGIGAANSGRVQESISLLEAVLAGNPYHRDALYAIALQHATTPNYASVLEYSNRLIALDPGNPDHYQLQGRAYQELLAEDLDDATKKSYTQGLLQATRRASDMPAKVNINQFTAQGDARILTGTVENLTEADASYVLQVEFLDKAGNVVATEQATVAPAAKSSAEFSVSAESPSIAAFRYAPIVN